tara:strand:- start:26 stop:136 length:111 start_codon:yes stop_codon:yes gene_type:complete
MHSSLAIFMTIANYIKQVQMIHIPFTAKLNLFTGIS